jgi:hypothetical protein
MRDFAFATPIPFPAPKRVWRLTVIDAFDVAPSLRRVRLVLEDDGFPHRPGENLILGLTRRTCGFVRRALAIRAFDHEEQVIDVDVPDDDPGFAWVSVAKLGDELTAEAA